MPEEIIFYFRKGPQILSMLLVTFILKSRVKNDYSLGLFLTDESGAIHIYKKDILELISKYQDEFSMDYSGNFQDCNMLTASVENRQQLLSRVKSLREFYPKEAKILETKIKKSINGEYQYLKEVQLPTLKRELFCNVEKK